MSFTSLKLFLLAMEFQKCSSAHFPKSTVLSIVQVAQTTLNVMVKLSKL